MISLKKILPFLCGLCLLAFTATAATLLPPGEIQFLDNNGQPLSGGLVYFYIPNTSTPKDTYKDSGQTQLNTNPVVLDSAGRAIIYGSGTYREILKDANGNLIFDQETADTSANNFSWAGTSGGTANAQTVTAPNFTNGDGQVIGFIAGATNTGALTLSVNGGTPIAVLKAVGSGPASLVGGEVVTNNQYQVVYSAGAGNFQLVAYPINPGFGQSTNIASATTTDLGTIISHVADITGTTTINSFGASANTSQPIYVVNFSGVLTLTYNATSLILPTAANITTAAGDSLVAQYLGSGNWQVISYSRASGAALVTTQTATTTTRGIATLGASAVIQEQETSGTVGSLYTSGSVTCVLNTVVADPHSIISSLSSNEFTLGAGSYLIEWSTPFQTTSAGGQWQSWLQDITGSATIARGNSESSGVTAAIVIPSRGAAIVSPSASNTYAIQFSANQGGRLGVAASQGTEVYATVIVTKLNQ